MAFDSQPASPPIDSHQVAHAILGAAGWARIGITMPDRGIRERAAQELALAIIEEIEPRIEIDPRQLALF